jgi:hypothetical protein
MSIADLYLVSHSGPGAGNFKNLYIFFLKTPVFFFLPFLIDLITLFIVNLA